MLGIEKYAKVKNTCCIGYFGPDYVALLELIDSREQILKLLPGIEIHLACRDEFAQKLKNVPNLIPSKELRSKRQEFAFFYEATSDGNQSPAVRLLNGIQSDKIQLEKSIVTNT